jgi:hypothetical protein
MLVIIAFMHVFIFFVSMTIEIDYICSLAAFRPAEQKAKISKK